MPEVGLAFSPFLDISQYSTEAAAGGILADSVWLKSSSMSYLPDNLLAAAPLTASSNSTETEPM